MWFYINPLMYHRGASYFSHIKISLILYTSSSHCTSLSQAVRYFRGSLRLPSKDSLSRRNNETFKDGKRFFDSKERSLRSRPSIDRTSKSSQFKECPSIGRKSRISVHRANNLLINANNNTTTSLVRLGPDSIEKMFSPPLHNFFQDDLTTEQVKTLCNSNSSNDLEALRDVNSANEVLKKLLNLTPFQRSKLWLYLTISELHSTAPLLSNLLPEGILDIIVGFDRLFYAYGILLSDMSPELFFNRVEDIIASRLPQEFLGADFLHKVKKSLYGDNSIPIPLPKKPHLAIEESLLPNKDSGEYKIPDTPYLRYKRQRLIEDLSKKITIDKLEEFLSLSKSSTSIVTRPCLQSFWIQWVFPLAEAIRYEAQFDALLETESVPKGVLSANEIAVVCIQQVLHSLLDQGVHKKSKINKMKEKVESKLSQLSSTLINRNQGIHDTKENENIVQEPLLKHEFHKQENHISVNESDISPIPKLNSFKKEYLERGEADLTTPLASVAVAIGRAINKHLAHKRLTASEGRKAYLDLHEILHIDTDTTSYDWTTEHCVEIGSRLLNLLLRHAYVELDADKAYDEIKMLLDSKREKRERREEVLDLNAKLLHEVERRQSENLLDSTRPFPSPSDVTPCIEMSSNHTKSVGSTEPFVLTLSEAIKQEDDTFLVEPSDPSSGRKMPAVVVQVMQSIERSKLFASIQISFLPMICRPLPWNPSLNKGAYFIDRPNFVRQIGPRAGIRARLARSTTIDQLANTVTKLGHQPWRINTKILEVVEEIWEKGGGIASIPLRQEQKLPQPPEYSKIKDPELWRQYRNDWRIVSNKFNLEANHQKRQQQSEIPTFLLRLSVAKQFKNADEIFFPHFLDFRGRAYPIPPHLNHQGGDLCRGLLMFAEPKRLGESGLNWLKIHLASVFGHDKKTFEERLHWTNENIELIHQIANDPLNPNVINRWTLTEKPWQILANCIELSSALSLPNPKEFLCHMPVHQDGTCNGLQHYAALGRDIEGGCAVNLVPSDVPGDIYMTVLREVERRINDIDENQQDHPHHSKARLILERSMLIRKVVKTTVMTICYGVTAVGAREQVEKQLSDRFGQELDKQTINELSKFISSMILQAVDTIFQKAMGLKTWLDNVSRITYVNRTTIDWISPCGLPCVQPYFDYDKVIISTRLQNVTISKEDSSKIILKSNSRKQKMGLPPNFIHSLDGSHMIMTAKRCFDKGLSFAAVHDSFWTHACDVDEMNRYIREEFINLHSMPLLRDFYDSLKRRNFVCNELTPPPGVGDLDISQVISSRYFFS